MFKVHAKFMMLRPYLLPTSVRLRGNTHRSSGSRRAAGCFWRESNIQSLQEFCDVTTTIMIEGPCEWRAAVQLDALAGTSGDSGVAVGTKCRDHHQQSRMHFLICMFAAVQRCA